MKRIAVLVSGTGTNLLAMIKEGVPIQLVLTDKDCQALEIAREAGIKTELVDRTDYGYRPKIDQDGWDRAGFSRAVAETLNRFEIDVAAMAGFMTILDPIFFSIFAGWLLNIHPAILPDFPGEHAVRDTIAAGRTETASTIHIATPVLDDHRYIVTRASGIPVYRTDTVELLHERIKERERVIYPRVLFDILAGRINLAAIKGES